MPYLTPTQLADFEKNGFLIERNLFDSVEIQLLQKTAKDDQELDRRSQGRKDRSGATVRLTLWNQPGDGIYGMFARCKKLGGRMEELLNGEVYHYHSKMILKDPEIGGAWEWHQDYGYWYHNACLYPDMGSCFIMLDKASKENGCLKVLKSSHKVGRIGHDVSIDTPEQTADMERISELEKRHETVYITAEPGDVLFFHSNLLHSSDANKSKNSRRTLIVCFNTKSNSPYKKIAHASYTPLNISSSNSIMDFKK